MNGWKLGRILVDVNFFDTQSVSVCMYTIHVTILGLNGWSDMSQNFFRYPSRTRSWLMDQLLDSIEMIMVKMLSTIKIFNLFFSTLTDLLRRKTHNLTLKSEYVTSIFKPFKNYGKFNNFLFNFPFF